MALQISQELADALVTGGMKSSMLPEVGDRLSDTLEIHTTEEYVGFFTTNPKFLEVFLEKRDHLGQKGFTACSPEQHFGRYGRGKGKIRRGKKIPPG